MFWILRVRGYDIRTHPPASRMQRPRIHSTPFGNLLFEKHGASRYRALLLDNGALYGRPVGHVSRLKPGRWEVIAGNRELRTLGTAATHAEAASQLAQWVRSAASRTGGLQEASAA